MSTDTLIEEQDAVCETTTLSAPADTAALGTSAPATEKPLCLSVEEFVTHVIYDGRFLDTFSVEPEGVAELLGVEIVPDVVEDLRGRDPVQVLAETTARMSSDYGRRDVIGIGLPDVHADFGISTAVVVGAIAIAVIVCVATGKTPVVTDDSPNADSKL